jgi:hypothetical protein
MSSNRLAIFESVRTATRPGATPAIRPARMASR